MPERKSSLRLEAGGMAVVFEWTGDRWAHRVLHEGSLLAESLEGPWPDGGDPRWPASPALQEAMTATADGGPSLLAVGRAGRAHFSASVTADTVARDTLRFDLACRIPEEPAWIGSTYRVAGKGPQPVRVAAADPGGGLPRTVRWFYAFGPGGLVAAAPPAPGGREP